MDWKHGKRLVFTFNFWCTYESVPGKDEIWLPDRNKKDRLRDDDGDSLMTSNGYGVSPWMDTVTESKVKRRVGLTWQLCPSYLHSPKRRTWRRHWRKQPLCGRGCQPGPGWWERTSRTAACASLREECCWSCYAPGGLSPQSPEPGCAPPEDLGTSAGPEDAEGKCQHIILTELKCLRRFAAKCSAFQQSYPRFYRQRHLWNVEHFWRWHCSRHSRVFWSDCETRCTKHFSVQTQ